MLNRLNSNAFLLIAALIISVNIIVLAGVVHNRNDTLAVLTLTERELSQPFNNFSEDSGVSLRIKYRVMSADIDYYTGFHRYVSPQWLTEEKLEMLGFEVNSLELDKDFIQIPQGTKKEVYVALEYDGAAYQQMLKEVTDWHQKEIEQDGSGLNVDRVNRRLETEKQTASRLFVIDAANDIDTLYKSFGDNPKVMYAKAVINMNRRHSRELNDYEFVGYITKLSVEKIHVSRPYSELFTDLPRRDHRDVKGPRYAVELAVGQKVEPFITKIALL